MSVRSVKCPACGAAANVPAAMANIKCPSCATVWNVNNPAAASRAATQATASSEDTSEESSKAHQKTLIAAIAGVLGLLALAGIAVAIFVIGAGAPTPEPTVVEPVSPQVIAEIPVETEPTYREVKLPESTRKHIYLEYRHLVGSSTEKKVPLMKESPVNKSLQSMLSKTVDREITHFSLIHNITEEDVLQIVAEGDAKRWPGARKIEPKKDDKKK